MYNRLILNLLSLHSVLSCSCSLHHSLRQLLRDFLNCTFRILFIYAHTSSFSI